MTRRLAAVTAARLRLSTPPLGDPSPLDGGAILLAAALGVASEPYSRESNIFGRLLDALPSAHGAWELVARHGLATPALTDLPVRAADDIRRASPLTAVLERPEPGGRRSQARALAARLRAAPDGGRMLRAAFAAPSADVAVLAWRADLLDRWRLDVAASGDGRSFVLDVYETALLHHREEHLDAVRRAAAILADSTASDDALDLARAVAAWWEPLAALARAEIDLLRARRHLGYAYREGIGLARRAQRLRVG